MSRTHGESFLKTSLQASTAHMQAVAIARHMLGIYNTFSPSPSFLLFDRGADRQEHTRPHAHCSSHTCVHSAQIRAHKGHEHQWRESQWECKSIRRTHKQPHVHRQTDVRCNLPTLNTLKNTTRHLTAVPGWRKKKWRGNVLQLGAHSWIWKQVPLPTYTRSALSMQEPTGDGDEN